MKVENLTRTVVYHHPYYLPFSENRGRHYCSRDDMVVVRGVFYEAAEDWRTEIMWSMVEHA